MDINAIVLELFSRVQILEKKVAELETRQHQSSTIDTPFYNRPEFPADKVSAKYKGLAEHLYQKWDKKIEMSYTDIENALGFTLPATDYNLPQSYWANTETHSYAKGSWLAVGYKAKVIGVEKICFERNLY